MTSTEEGMQIDDSDQQLENADSPIRVSAEPVSNVTLDRVGHPSKHESQRIVTDEGMQIDESDVQFANAYGPKLTT
jgi:hypothetical protein